MKYIPGPFKVARFSKSPGCGAVVYQEGFPPKLDSKNRLINTSGVVAEIWYRRHDNGKHHESNDFNQWDATEAIAHIFAAAPDLLDCLVQALPYVEDDLAQPCYKPGVAKKVLSKFRAAIAKAEGKENVQHL